MTYYFQQISPNDILPPEDNLLKVLLTSPTVEQVPNRRAYGEHFIPSQQISPEDSLCPKP